MSNYNYESELQKALRLSEQTFKKEQKLREQAKKLQEQMKAKKEAIWTEEKSYSMMLELMKWQPLFINRGVGSGLQNLGNSCFMNATLQCLAYSPAFAQLLCQSNHGSQCKSNKFCALCEMERVIPSMLMGKQIVKPRNLFRNLPKINDLLTPGCQEDAHEFIQSLLDKIEWAYDDNNPQYPKRRKDPQNPIRKLFTGATKTCIQCARCKTKSVTKEPFCCISLEVDDNVGLGEALEIFTQDELMRGEDKYFCNTCNRKCVAHKRLTLSQIPPILILHFKRFCVEFAASHHKQGTTKKLADHVEFPEVLDFKKLKHLIFEEDQEMQLIDPQYELYGVLVHSGPQLGYGHYYALIKSADGHWFRMNDMDVIPVTIKHVLREQGYIVFYRRKTDNLMKCELQRIRAQNGNNNNNLNNMQNNDDNKEQNEQNIAIDRYNNNINNNNVDDGNGIKVNTDLLTNDYFANNCNQPQDLVMVDDMNNGNNNLSFLPDRTQYVQVPPIATRPELNDNDKPLNNNKNEQEVFHEVFWPVTNIDQ